MKWHCPTTRHRWWRLLAVSMVAAIAGCVPPGKPDPADKPVMPGDVLDFHTLYSQQCAGCHGADGELGPAPPLQDHLFAAIVPEEELLRVIREGRRGTPMPAFAIDRGGPLTDAQVQVLAAGIKSKWSSPDVSAEGIPPYLLSRTTGVQPSPGSRQRGEQIFARACASCHGANGLGGEDAIGGAINVPAFLALISDQAIRRIIITGRPDLGMPNYAESHDRPADFQPLTSAEIDDLVALVADWRATSAVAGANHD